MVRLRQSANRRSGEGARLSFQLLAALAAAALLVIGACQQPKQTTSQQVRSLKTAQIGASGSTVEEVQADLEAFADEHSARIAQVTTEMANEINSAYARYLLHAIKLSTSSSAYLIAAGPNPVVGMIDMMVHLSLIRRVVEEQLPRRLDHDCSALIEMLRFNEEGIWTLSDKLLSQAQEDELKGMIDAWFEANPNVYYVFEIRFSDFAHLRRASSIDRRDQSGSVFSLLLLDPFAKLDPAMAELAEARLLTERIFYYAQRLPKLATWRAELLYLTLAKTPEFQQAMANSSALSDSAVRLTKTADELRTLLPDQTAAAVDEINVALTAQREAFTQDLDRQQEQLGPLISDLRGAMSDARVAAEQVNTAMEVTERTALTLQDTAKAVTAAGQSWGDTAGAVTETIDLWRAGRDPASPGNQVEAREILQSIEHARETAMELRSLVAELTALASDDALSHNLTASVDETRLGLRDVIDYATWRALLVIAAIFVAAIVYRLIAVRVIGRPSA